MQYFDNIQRDIISYAKRTEAKNDISLAERLCLGLVVREVCYFADNQRHLIEDARAKFLAAPDQLESFTRSIWRISPTFQALVTGEEDYKVLAEKTLVSKATDQQRHMALIHLLASVPMEKWSPFYRKWFISVTEYVSRDNFRALINHMAGCVTKLLSAVRNVPGNQDMHQLGKKMKLLAMRPNLTIVGTEESWLDKMMKCFPDVDEATEARIFTPGRTDSPVVGLLPTGHFVPAGASPAMVVVQAGSEANIYGVRGRPILISSEDEKKELHLTVQGGVQDEIYFVSSPVAVGSVQQFPGLSGPSVPMTINRGAVATFLGDYPAPISTDPDTFTREKGERFVDAAANRVRRMLTLAADEALMTANLEVNAIRGIRKRMEDEYVRVVARMEGGNGESDGSEEELESVEEVHNVLVQAMLRGNEAIDQKAWARATKLGESAFDGAFHLGTRNALTGTSHGMYYDDPMTRGQVAQRAKTLLSPGSLRSAAAAWAKTARKAPKQRRQPSAAAVAAGALSGSDGSGYAGSVGSADWAGAGNIRDPGQASQPVLQYDRLGTGYSLPGSDENVDITLDELYDLYDKDESFDGIREYDFLGGVGTSLVDPLPKTREYLERTFPPHGEGELCMDPDLEFQLRNLPERDRELSDVNAMVMGDLAWDETKALEKLMDVHCVSGAGVMNWHGGGECVGWHDSNAHKHACCRCMSVALRLATTRPSPVFTSNVAASLAEEEENPYRKQRAAVENARRLQGGIDAECIAGYVEEAQQQKAEVIKRLQERTRSPTATAKLVEALDMCLKYQTELVVCMNAAVRGEQLEVNYLRKMGDERQAHTRRFTRILGEDDVVEALFNDIDLPDFNPPSEEEHEVVAPPNVFDGSAAAAGLPVVDVSDSEEGSDAAWPTPGTKRRCPWTHK